MSNPQDKQPRKFQVLKPAPREQRRNWQRENRERENVKRQRINNSQPPNGNDAA